MFITIFIVNVPFNSNDLLSSTLQGHGELSDDKSKLKVEKKHRTLPVFTSTEQTTNNLVSVWEQVRLTVWSNQSKRKGTNNSSPFTGQNCQERSRFFLRSLDMNDLKETSHNFSTSLSGLTTQHYLIIIWNNLDIIHNT